MIQRIQTLYLFIVAVLCVLMFVFPFATITDGSVMYKFMACGLRDAASGAYAVKYMVLPALIAVNFLASLSQYSCSRRECCNCAFLFSMPYCWCCCILSWAEHFILISSPKCHWMVSQHHTVFH